MKSELLNCPFCGNQPVPIPPTSLVQCIHCQISMTKGDWNTRPESPLGGLDRNKLKKIIRYQMEARGASINPKDDFEGFVYDIEQAICAKFGSPQKESFHSCHFIPCPVCEKNKPNPRFVEVDVVFLSSYIDGLIMNGKVGVDIAHALASNPSAWMKRKDSDEAKAV